MFRAIWVNLVKVGIAIFLLALAFWPNGPGKFIMENFASMPILYMVIVATWGCALSLNLPLSLTNFRRASTICLSVIFAAVMVKLNQTGYFDIANSNSWIITSIFFVGTILGWWTISAQLWRWYRRVLPVDDTGSDDGEE